MMIYVVAGVTVVILGLSAGVKYYKSSAETAQKESKLNKELLDKSQERETVCNGKIVVFKKANEALEQSTADKELARLAAEKLREAEEAKSKRVADELKNFKKTGDACKDMKGIVDEYAKNRGN